MEDPTPLTKDQIQHHTTEQRDEVAITVSDNHLNEGSKDLEKSIATFSETDHPDDEIETRGNKKDGNSSEIVLPLTEHPKPLKSVNEVCNETVVKTVERFSAEEYPSFDEPAKSNTCFDVNQNESEITCASTGSLSGDENSQRNANISPQEETVSVFKKHAMTSPRGTNANVPSDQNYSAMHSNIHTLSRI
mmetsp:Transcript_113880/g.233017  ORF Transcript_113880/g.233017 Transcript_113880/m.233017 type:complete len:191 (+) Transcript_113880:1018-1590(+)